MSEGTDSSARPVTLGPGQGRPIELGNFQMHIKATSEETSGAFSLLEADEPPGFGPPMHIHHDCAEAFYVLEGEYIIFIRDDRLTCPAGSYVYIPAGTPHGFRVGGVQSRKLNLYSPGAMIGYFDELSDAIANGTADPEFLSAMALRYSVEMIGPVPEGYL